MREIAKVLLGALVLGGMGNASAQTLVPTEGSAPQPNVAGIELGMTPENVRAILKQRKLPMHEFAARMVYAEKETGTYRNMPSSQFVNAIVQSAPSSAAGAVDNLMVSVLREIHQRT